jgi:hypothetical protein
VIDRAPERIHVTVTVLSPLIDVDHEKEAI